MTSDKKIIVVVGATGNQGSSVANTFLSLAGWHVRCVTRNPSSPAAQALSARGAEVVQADLSDPPSLGPAFDSATAIFANTDFWGPYRDPNTVSKAAAESTTSSQLAFDLEVSHGMNIADAAAGLSTLERFVYSALGPMKKASKGKYPHSYHWDSKATVVEYIETEHPDLAKKMSVIYLGAYTTNSFLHPRFDPTAGKHMYVLPMSKTTKLPIIDANESTGLFVRELIEDEEPGKKLLAYDSNLNIEEIVELWSRITGMEAGFVQVTAALMHEKFGIPLEVLDGPAFMEEFGYMYGVEGAIEPADLKTKVQTRSYEEWLKGRNWDEILQQGKAELKTVEGK